MPTATHLWGTSVSGARWGYEFNPTDDLMSLRRWLSRIVSPATAGPIGQVNGNPGPGEPNFYIEPDEGEFVRPAVTIQLIEEGASTYSPSDEKVRPRAWNSQLSITFKAYGDPEAAIGGRADTIRIANLVWRALNEGGPDFAAYRPPLWAFALHARVARRLRVLRTSLSMPLEDTDDQRRWVRPINARIIAPRTRPLARPVPVLSSAELSIGVR
jgi:hypothetical protein